MADDGVLHPLQIACVVDVPHEVDVGRIDRQVGHFPDLAVRRVERLEALVDRVLVRAREGGEDQVAAIGMARMHGQLVAVLHGLADLVDVREVDLGIDALREQRIRAAGLDVFVQEPLPVDSPLLHLANVVATPHIGSATQETREAMARCAVENLLSALAGQRPANLVNEQAWGNGQPNNTIAT